jgi:ribosomal protein S1
MVAETAAIGGETPGQSLNGTVKSTTRAGTFVTLPDGSEGFLPREEVALFTLIGQSAMEIGKQIRVKVLNVAHVQATLIMKGVEDDEDDLKTLNMELKRDWSRGTNAFELASVGTKRSLHSCIRGKGPKCRLILQFLLRKLKAIRRKLLQKMRKVVKN